MTNEFIVVSQGGAQGPAGSGAIGLGWYDVTDYGAVHNVESGAAIQAAIDDMPAEGGVLFFPPGNWISATTLDLEGRRNIILRGNGGITAGAQTTTLLYTTMTGSGRFLNCRSTKGVHFQDMQLSYTSSSFTGKLIDYSHGAEASDSAYGGLQGCLVSGMAAATATLVYLDKAIFMTFSKTHFSGSDISVYGQAASSYSNVISFFGCVFHDTTTVMVRNPGEAWTFSGCGFNGDGTAAAFDHDTGVLTQGLFFSGCWSGDTTGGTVYKVAGEGIAFIGNYIGATSGTGIDLDEVSAGVVIEGNDFASHTTGVDFSSLAHTGVSMRNNAFTGGSAEHAGSTSIASGVVQSSNSVTYYGETVFADGNDVGVGTTTGTKIGTAATQKLGFWNATPVVQVSGWGTPTGTATRTAFGTPTVTVEALAERVKGLIDDLKTYGILGA